MKTKLTALCLAGIILLAGCQRFAMLTEPLEFPRGSLFYADSPPDLTDPTDGEPGQWPPKTAAERRRIYAFGAYHSWNLDLTDTTLGGATGLSQRVVTRTLRDEFGIEDADTAKSMLNWVKKGGMTSSDQYYYGSNELFLVAQGKILPPVHMDDDEEEWLKEIYESYVSALSEYDYTEEELMGVDTTIAGDLDLLVTVARMSYSAEYLTEEETWEYLGYAEQLATESYDTWREYLAGVFFSTAFYSMEDFYEHDVADYLLGNRLSPYTLFEFGAREEGAPHNYFGWHAEM